MNAGAEPTSPIVRHAARIILLDEEDRVLLFRWQVPGEMNPERIMAANRTVWITPGGGLDPGETHEQAALRELWEETGLTGVPLGPCIWERSHTFRFRDTYLQQRERYFLACTDRVDLSSANWTPDEVALIRDHRWWSVPEILGASGERFAPRGLGVLLAGLLKEGPPPTVLTIDV